MWSGAEEKTDLDIAAAIGFRKRNCTAMGVEKSACKVHTEVSSER